MKLLVIGDVVGEAGIDALHGLLRRIKRDTGADFVIVNGENAAGNGVLPRQADDIFAAGADVITLGNHVFGKQQIVPIWTAVRMFSVRPILRRKALAGAGAFMTARRACACSS